EQPIVEAAAKEIKTMLGAHLGATLVESGHRWWTPDPQVERMRVDYRRALAQLVPVFMPDILFRLTKEGRPLFAEFAAAILRTEFQPGKFFGSGTMQPMDYLVGLAEGTIEPPANFDLATIQQQELAPTFRFHISQYLARRASAKVSTVGPRSMRARNSGVTTSAPPSRTGRRSPTRAIRSVSAKAST